jgi:acyl-CoA synthetase (AMP-forming)/AMP-acid ligase II
MGAWLQSKGLQPGARVAIMLPNVLQYPVAMAAVLRAGYTVVNVNPLYTARTAAPAGGLGAEAIIVLENFATTVEQVVAHTVKHVIVASWAICWAASKARWSTSWCASEEDGAGLHCRRRVLQARAGRRRTPDAAAGQAGP